MSAIEDLRRAVGIYDATFDIIGTWCADGRMVEAEAEQRERIEAMSAAVRELQAAPRGLVGEAKRAR